MITWLDLAAIILAAFSTTAFLVEAYSHHLTRLHHRAVYEDSLRRTLDVLQQLRSVRPIANTPSPKYLTAARIGLGELAEILRMEFSK